MISFVTRSSGVEARLYLLTFFRWIVFVCSFLPLKPLVINGRNSSFNWRNPLLGSKIQDCSKHEQFYEVEPTCSRIIIESIALISACTKYSLFNRIVSPSLWFECLNLEFTKFEIPSDYAPFSAIPIILSNSRRNEPTTEKPTEKR